jgi:hypothetical protein
MQVGLLPLDVALTQGAASKCPFSQMARHEASTAAANNKAIIVRPPGKLLFAACTALPQLVRNAKYMLYDVQSDEVCCCQLCRFYDDCSAHCTGTYQRPLLQPVQAWKSQLH